MISWPIFPQLPPTDIHPPPSSDWDREAKAKMEADSIYFLNKLYQSLYPSTAIVPVKYFRWYEFTFGVLQLTSKIDDFIFSLCCCKNLIYWLNMSFDHHICCCCIVCYHVNYLIKQNSQLAGFLATWQILIFEYCVNLLLRKVLCIVDGVSITL